jgi:hypothetical protein
MWFKKKKNINQEKEMTIEERLSYNVVLQDNIIRWINFEEKLLPDERKDTWLGILENIDLKTIAYESEDQYNKYADIFFSTKSNNNLSARLLDLELRLNTILPKKYLENVKNQLLEKLYSYEHIEMPYPTQKEWDKTNEKYPYFYLLFIIKDLLLYNQVE